MVHVRTQEGFSVSILTGECVSNSHCGGNQWFWGLTILATLVYATWYTFKDDVFKFLTGCLKCIAKTCTLNQVKESKNSVRSKMHQKTGKVDKGYFGIVAFYVQMAAVIKVTIEFNDNDDS